MLYFPLFAGKEHKHANIKATPFIEPLVNRKITQQRDKPLFKKAIVFLKKDFDVKNVLMELLNYIDEIIIYKVVEAESTEDYDIEDEGLKDTTNISIYNFLTSNMQRPGKGNGQRSNPKQQLQRQ